MAAGAIFAAGATSTDPEDPDTVVDARTDPAPLQILREPSTRQTQPDAAELVSHLRTAERIAAEARRPRSVLPTIGTLTSGYGPRWGANHNGLDIANSIGTPVLAVTDGEVIEAGPVDGFGLWVRIRQDDGTVGIYGHIDASLVVAGQRIQAGQQIATMGNRGQSTGPHLHYEVWLADGTKLDPAAWLLGRGVPLPGVADTNS